MIAQLTTWFSSLSGTEQIFCYTGLISNILFIFYILLSVFGNDHDADLEDAGFTILSIRGLLAFGMFLGWTALVVSRSGAPWPLALAAGVGAGWLAAWLAWRVIRMLLTWQTSGTLDLHTAIGMEADVYLFIPDGGKGQGKVTIALQGAERELDAITDGPAIPTGGKVMVMGLDEKERLIVIPINN